MAKEKRNGNIPERQRPRLPHLTWDLQMMWNCLHPPRNSYGKCCKIQEKYWKKWDLEFIQKRRIFSATRASSTRTHRKELEIEDMKIEILTRSESVKYLGQKISFHLQRTTEIKNRIRAAWATFRTYRQELTSKNYMLNHRLRLFDAAISPTLCYAAGTWTPNKEHERMIQSMQHKMLRLIIQTKRRYKNRETRN